MLHAGGTGDERKSTNAQCQSTTEATDTITEATDSVRASFGSRHFYGAIVKVWVIVKGSNGYACSGGVDDDLKERLKRNHARTGTIECLRLLLQ